MNINKQRLAQKMQKELFEIMYGMPSNVFENFVVSYLVKDKTVDVSIDLIDNISSKLTILKNDLLNYKGE